MGVSTILHSHNAVGYDYKDGRDAHPYPVKTPGLDTLGDDHSLHTRRGRLVSWLDCLAHVALILEMLS